MKKTVLVVLGFSAGVIASAAFNLLRPITSDEALLKGIISFAGRLEGYGFQPKFDPRDCEVSEWKDDAARTFGVHLYVDCSTVTDNGTFSMFVGYDRFGATVDGYQWLSEEE